MAEFKELTSVEKAQRTRKRRCQLRKIAESVVVPIAGHGRFAYDEKQAEKKARVLRHGARRTFDVFSTLFVAAPHGSDEAAWDWAVDELPAKLASHAGTQRRVVTNESGEPEVRKFVVGKEAYNLGILFAEAAFAKARRQQAIARKTKLAQTVA